MTRSGAPVFDVVVNDEEQYSIWAQGQPPPDGWRTVGFVGSREECLAHIDRVWTDIRPLSVRQRIEQERAEQSAAPMTDEQVIGILGAGQIGRSVAHVFAERAPVVLVDRDPGALTEARAAIRHAQLGRLLRHATTLAPDAVLGNIRTATTITALKGVALIVENITESPEEKLAAHRELADQLAGDTPVAANTSAVPLAYLAGAHGPTAGRLLGLHFMMPVPEIRWLELIRGANTSEAALAVVAALLDRHGLTAIEVRDSPGFVSNRILMLLVNEAAAVVREGVAAPSDVDAVLERCFGHRLGPLATADLIGLDTVVHSLQVLQRFADPVKYAPDEELARLVAAGRLGRKSGRGFYDYGAAGRMRREDAS